MKELTNMQLKQIIVSALRNEYGFAPKCKDVVLLEATGDGTYIFAEVNGNVYSFNSDYRLGIENGVYTGKGTIDKKNEEDYR